MVTKQEQDYSELEETQTINPEQAFLDWKYKVMLTLTGLIGAGIFLIVCLFKLM